MGKVLSKAFAVRMDHQKKVGRTVTITEVSDQTGIARLTLRRIERGETQGIDFEVLAKLCAFYGVTIGDLLEYDPNSQRAIMRGSSKPIPA